MTRPKSPPFVTDAVDEYLRTKRAKEPKTLSSYNGVLRGSDRGTKRPLGTPLAPFFHNRRIDTVTHDEVAGWFTQRVHGGSQDLKHRVSKQARSFFRFAHARGYTQRDLSTAIDPYPPGEPRRNWLPWPDVHCLLAVIPEFRFRYAVAWLFYTGCRVGEATAANQNDVRLIPGTALYVWSIPTTKTHKAREVWLPDALAVYIRQSRAEHNPRPVWPVLWDSEGRGFGRVEDPASRITAATINGVLERARAAAGIQITVTAHVARHTYCTNWIKEKGTDEHSMTKLSRQVGTSVSRLRSTYVHVQYTDADWEDIRSFGQPSTQLNQGRNDAK